MKRAWSTPSVEGLCLDQTEKINFGQLDWNKDGSIDGKDLFGWVNQSINVIASNFPNIPAIPGISGNDSTVDSLS